MTSALPSPCLAQDDRQVDPPKVENSRWVAEMYLRCDEGTGEESEVVYGEGADCAAAIADAIAQLNELELDCCEEPGCGIEPIPTLIDCYEDPEKVAGTAKSAEATSPALPWKVRLTYKFCNGQRMSAEGKGCSYGEAYRNAMQRICLLSSIYGAFVRAWANVKP